MNIYCTHLFLYFYNSFFVSCHALIASHGLSPQSFYATLSYGTCPHTHTQARRAVHSRLVPKKVFGSGFMYNTPIVEIYKAAGLCLRPWLRPDSDSDADSDCGFEGYFNVLRCAEPTVRPLSTNDVCRSLRVASFPFFMYQFCGFALVSFCVFVLHFLLFATFARAFLLLSACVCVCVKHLMRHVWRNPTRTPLTQPCSLPNNSVSC